ncbi:hypothetical protein GGR57DRAFT_95041 [Xylariaceae sp. FL1272]|nr:hypothetical protein GGR57DRAFT_95041 [Xylariaceae sp. FL1272]
MASPVYLGASRCSAGLFISNIVSVYAGKIDTRWSWVMMPNPKAVAIYCCVMFKGIVMVLIGPCPLVKSFCCPSLGF